MPKPTPYRTLTMCIRPTAARSLRRGPAGVPPPPLLPTQVRQDSVERPPAPAGRAWAFRIRPAEAVRTGFGVLAKELRFNTWGVGQESFDLVCGAGWGGVWGMMRLRRSGVSDYANQQYFCQRN